MTRNGVTGAATSALTRTAVECCFHCLKIGENYGRNLPQQSPCPLHGGRPPSICWHCGKALSKDRSRCDNHDAHVAQVRARLEKRSTLRESRRASKNFSFMG